MKEQFVTYNIALKLKELGFDEECLAYYIDPENPFYEDNHGNKTNFMLLSAKKRGELVGHGTVRNFLFNWLKQNNRTAGELHTLSKSITAPLWQQAQSFFREKYNLHIAIDKVCNLNNTITFWNYEICYTNTEEIIMEPVKGILSYEKAREQAILKAIELCQKK